MKINTFIKDSKTNQIHLNGKLINSFVKMIEIIINNNKIEYHFKNFNKNEAKIIKAVTKKYGNYSAEIHQKQYLTIMTHNTKTRNKRNYFLDELSVPLKQKISSMFDTIDKIEIKEMVNKNIIVIEGTILLQNINKEKIRIKGKNKYNNNINLNNQKKQAKLNYVRKRVR